MDNKGKHAAPAGGKSLFHRLRVLVLVLCVVLVVAALTTMEDGRHFASLRRWLMYGESSATQDVYSYAADPGNLYGRLGDGMVVVGSNAIQIYRNDGNLVYELSPLGMEHPYLTVGRRQAAVCDLGGGTLRLLDQNGLRKTLNMDRGLCYYSARLNGSDYLAVVEQKNGYKARVSVYNSMGEMVFHFDSYDNYISDAVVTQNCRSVVQVSLESQNGIFSSRLMVYSLDGAELVSSRAIRDGLVLDLASNEDRILALCDKRFVIATLDGETLLDRAYGNLYLYDYALEGGDFCALLLGRYQAGNISTLTTYDLNGEEIASLDLTEEVLDISAAGDYLAVLYGERLVIYDRALEERSRLEEVGYAGQVRMNEDGTVLVISGTSSQRFLP